MYSTINCPHTGDSVQTGSPGSPIFEHVIAHKKIITVVATINMCAHVLI